jgi:hypothetical protein
VGQNADASRKVAITQSFHRMGGELAWQPVITSSTVLSLLDAFFLGNQGGAIPH